MEGAPSLRKVPLLHQIVCFTSIFHSLLGNTSTRKAITWTESSPKAALQHSDVRVSSNTLTVLSWLTRKNRSPALSLLDQTARAHHKRYGTHTTYLIVLTGLLSAKVRRLQEEGFLAEEIGMQLQLFRADVNQLLSREKLDRSGISELALEAGVNHSCEKTAGAAAFVVAQKLKQTDPTGNWHFGSIVVVKKALNSIPQCRVLDGVFVQTKACSSNAVRKLLQSLQPGKLAVFVGKLGRFAEDCGSHNAAPFRSTATTELPALDTSAELKDVSFVHRMCESLRELGVTVVVCYEQVEETVVRVCADLYSILVLPSVTMADLEFLARSFSCFLLGRLGEICERSISATDVVVSEVKELSSVTQCLVIASRDTPSKLQHRDNHPTNPLCVLCIATASVQCDTLENAFWTTLYRMRNISTSQTMYYGGCVAERALREKLEIKQQGRCPAAFTEAIEELEQIVARNLKVHEVQRCCSVFDDVQGKDSAIARAFGLVEICLFGTLV